MTESARQANLKLMPTILDALEHAAILKDKCFTIFGNGHELDESFDCNVADLLVDQLKAMANHISGVEG